MEARALAVILAAGEGKRMRSLLPKVLHRLGGQPLVEHVVQTCLRAGMDRTLVVVGHRRDMVITALRGYPIEFVIQDPQLGTGHAMQMVAAHVGTFHATCVVMLGDAPFITKTTLAELVNQHRAEQNAATVLTAEVDDPTGYGRIVRGAGGQVEGIVEDGDATEAQRALREINSGIYCLEYHLMTQALTQLGAQNEQGEYYLTDVVGILRGDGHRVGAVKVSDAVEAMGINDFRQLAEGERIMVERRPPVRPEPPQPSAAGTAPSWISDPDFAHDESGEAGGWSADVSSPNATPVKEASGGTPKS